MEKVLTLEEALGRIAELEKENAEEVIRTAQKWNAGLCANSKGRGVHKQWIKKL